MIIFKLISVEFKQNLKLEYSKKKILEVKQIFYFILYILKNIYIYIGQVRGSFELPRLAIALPLM